MHVVGDLLCSFPIYALELSTLQWLYTTRKNRFVYSDPKAAGASHAIYGVNSRTGVQHL